MMNKGKASWDDISTRAFIHECIDQIYKRKCQGLSFTRNGWKAIMSAFHEKTGRLYDRKQLKNRLDSLKKEWTAWDKLFSKETGVAFDYSKNMVIAKDEWWEKKIKENPVYEKYRFRELKFARELEILFKDVMAMGHEMFTPSSTYPMSLGNNKEHVYRPTMDLEEGFGDSEEELVGATIGGSAGLPSDLDVMTLKTNSQPGQLNATDGSRSIEKMKKGERARTLKKQKILASKQIADAASAIADVAKERVNSCKNMSTFEGSEVMAELVSMKEVSSDPDFCLRCMNMMMHKQCRVCFVGFKANKDALLKWLWYHAFNTPAFQIPPNT